MVSGFSTMSTYFKWWVLLILSNCIKGKTIIQVTNIINDHTADRLRWDNIGYVYDEKILTPFSAGVKNPLFDCINKLDRDNVVADFGCGTGRLVEILSKKEFKKVCGIDYSEL